MASETNTTRWPAEALARIALLEDALLAEREARLLVEGERDRARKAYQEALVAFELLRRKLFAAKAERLDTTQLDLEFERKRKELDALAEKVTADANTPPTPPAGGKPRSKPTGRRDLSECTDVETVDVEIPDAEMEALVAAGLAERFGLDAESSTMKWRRGGPVRLVLSRVKYRLAKLEGAAGAEAAKDAGVDSTTVAASGTSAPAPTTMDAVAQPPADDRVRIDRTNGTTIVTARMPPVILPRAMGTPSMYAHIIHEKFRRGLPFYRQEQQIALDGFALGRGTMSRWTHDVGVKCGPLVDAMRADAKRTAFCIATDATHVLVQPAPREDKKRQACKTGHFFAVVADRDHVLFEYTAKEDSKAVMRIFRGFAGYVQADAKSVYDILFRAKNERPPDDHPDLAHDGAERTEVGCWAHARRKFFECAITNQSVEAREALLRIRRLFEHEEEWRKLAPAQRKAMRQSVSRLELESFFAWTEIEWRKVEHQRGLLRTALGYVRNQREALLAYLEDGRLHMDNNRTEREIKNVVMGRKAWLFVGSDDHGATTANLLSLVGSAKLHGLDDEEYLRDLFRVLPFWPEERLLEIAPKYWTATRGRLDPIELEQEIGWLTIPPPITPSSPKDDALPPA